MQRQKLKPLMLIALMVLCHNGMAEDTDKAERGERINQLLIAAQSDASQANKNWQEAALLNSGLAHAKLAELALKESPPNRKKAVYHYTQAAQYGYPESYKTIASLLKDQQATHKKTELLLECYQNVLKPVPNIDLLRYCRVELADSFHYNRNQGVQSEFEAELKASTHLLEFCRNPEKAQCLNPDLGEFERRALFQKICQGETAQYDALKVGDIVLKAESLFAFDGKALKPYLKPIVDDLVVYRLNPPLSLFVYQNGQLNPLEEGDTMIKDNQAFMVKNNRLVQR